ncbi:LysM peptidoglycan-binding domain-containing protein [Mycobacterium sp. SMC-14]|uniref:LysM peptidoglycan-binding domain-containing protein n=1 Tax=Mycobacterium sp. SMC-14 TaxID=3385968 RepID=UPI00390C72FC
MLSGVITVTVAVMAASRSRRDSSRPSPTVGADAPASLRPASTGRRHTVVAGESLWSIAEHYYGDGSRFREIAAANNIPNPESITIMAAKRPARHLALITTEGGLSVEAASMQDLEEIHAALESAMSAMDPRHRP